MEGTPKLQRKFSLSLGRVTRKRDCESPKSSHRTEMGSVSSASNRFTIADPQQSPSSNSDYGTENTPPHKKLNLDDSIDYSPQPFDTSYSPTFMLSQTLAIDSPEVGWRWGRSKYKDRKEASSTPDSAYAADSSFTSSESINVDKNSRSNGRYLFSRRREEQRKAKEHEMRRAEKSRATELLKKRCARIQEQLNDAKGIKHNSSSEKCQKKQEPRPESTNNVEHMSTIPVSFGTTNTAIQMADTVVMTNSNANDTLEGFLNDSEMDDLLLAATQKIESSVSEVAKSQPQLQRKQQLESQPQPQSESEPVLWQKSPIGTTMGSSKTPISAHKHKRSSLYMKFLEDDADDWFASLDDVALEVVEAKKPRSSFQRYNSMPVPTQMAATTAAVSSSAATSAPPITIAPSKCPPSTKVSSESSIVSKLKRHASSHALSPSRTRGAYAQQIHRRK